MELEEAGEMYQNNYFQEPNNLTLTYIPYLAMHTVFPCNNIKLDIDT